MTLEIQQSGLQNLGEALGELGEVDDRSAKRPWEPTPLAPNLSINRQNAIRNQMYDILEQLRPDYVNNELFEFIEILYMSRDANRDVKNYESYSSRLFEEDSIEQPVILESIERAKYGTADIDELFTVAETLGMASIELAKLTHIYGYRLKYIDDMRLDVARAIKSNDGKLYDAAEADERFTVQCFDSSISQSTSPQNGLMMYRKRTIGNALGYDVYERSSFVVNLDISSGTNIHPNLIRYLKNYETNAYNSKEVDGHPAWSYDMLKNSSLKDEVSRCIRENDFVSVIPLSTTVFAHNPEIEEVIKLRDEERREESRDALELALPITTQIRKLNS